MESQCTEQVKNGQFTQGGQIIGCSPQLSIIFPPPPAVPQFWETGKIIFPPPPAVPQFWETGKSGASCPTGVSKWTYNSAADEKLKNVCELLILFINSPSEKFQKQFIRAFYFMFDKLSSYVMTANGGILGKSLYKLACLSVCLCPINVKTAEPIWPKFLQGSRVTPGKVYEW